MPAVLPTAQFAALVYLSHIPYLLARASADSRLKLPTTGHQGTPAANQARETNLPYGAGSLEMPVVRRRVGIGSSTEYKVAVYFMDLSTPIESFSSSLEYQVDLKNTKHSPLLQGIPMLPTHKLLFNISSPNCISDPFAS